MTGASAAIYSSGLSTKGPMLEETMIVLRQIDQGHNVDRVREMVIEQDLLAKNTRNTRETIWKRLHFRYLNDDSIVRSLARMAVHAPDQQTEKLVLLYEFCRSSPLLRDVTVGCVYPRYAEGFSGIDKTVIQRFFDKIATTHPEILGWSPQTRDKVISNCLTILRDFGLLKGTQRKIFSHVYVPLPAFVYVLYRLAGDGVTTPRQVLEDSDWRLFFLEQTDVVMLLEEASAADHCTFKHAADVYTLDLRYPSMEACVEALTREV